MPAFPALLLLLWTAPAFARERHAGPDHNQIRGARGDVHTAVDWYETFGLGGRVEFAVVPNGFIRGATRDELALSFGGDVFFAPTWLDWPGLSWHDGPYAVPVGAVQWNFYLGDHWSIFPEAGVAVHVDLDPDRWPDAHGHAYPGGAVGPVLGAGARYHFGERTALLMRLGTPGGLQVGLTF